MDETERAARGMTVGREVPGDAHVDRAVASITPFAQDFQDLITRYAWARSGHVQVCPAGSEAL